jgi:hypothetical protein
MTGFCLKREGKRWRIELRRRAEDLERIVEEQTAAIKGMGELVKAWMRGSPALSRLTDPTAMKAYTFLKAGVIKGLSIGYDTIKDAMGGKHPTTEGASTLGSRRSHLSHEPIGDGFGSKKQLGRASGRSQSSIAFGNQKPGRADEEVVGKLNV